MLDIHTHTKFSHDGKENPSEMVAEAERMGLRYLAFTDHLDLDYLANFRYILVSQLNVKKQYTELTSLIDNYKGDLILAKGIEVGYSKEVEAKYKKIIDEHDYDVVINSVHTINNLDLYFKKYFLTRSREEAFAEYLQAIRDSVYADYSYDIIGHMGYILRYSPYTPKDYCYEEYAELIDEILIGIIERGKSLEVNSKTKNEEAFIPAVDVLKRYKELGGKLISFGSDAHRKHEIAGKYQQSATILKEIGFDTWAVYKGRKLIEMPL